MIVKDFKKNKPVQRIAVIHDLCSIGKAGMSMILPVLSTMGIEVSPIPSMILSTHTGGFGKPVMQSLSDFPIKCAKHLITHEMKFDYIFVGYLGNHEAVENAELFLEEFSSTRVLLDPIMADHGVFYQNFDPVYSRKICTILKKSDIITPNYTESCFLTSEPYNEECSHEKIRRICEKLSSHGVKQIVITSVPYKPNHMSIAVYEKGELAIMDFKKTGRNYPGTGDLFAAVLMGKLMKGNSLEFSVKFAHEFVYQCISMSDHYGYPVREGVCLEANLHHLLSDVRS